MTHHRKMMLEELERRNYAQTTTRLYLQTIEDFARYFKRPPDQLGPQHIREYQAYLFRERKLAARTVTQRLACQRRGRSSPSLTKFLMYLSLGARPPSRPFFFLPKNRFCGPQ